MQIFHSGSTKKKSMLMTPRKETLAHRFLTVHLMFCSALVLNVLSRPCGAEDAEDSDNSQDAASVSVHDLRCEYLTNPLGIDAACPRLSWKLKAREAMARGQRQTAYQILVASSRNNLDRQQGDLWDSGDVASEQSIHVAYQGQKLASGQRCYWKVRVRDEAGQLSPWSKPARWSMGLLERADWTARWIGSAQEFVEVKKIPPTGDYLADPWLRKVFELPDKPTSAVIYVASVGYHELYVNGEKVTDTVLAPAVADHTQRARYVAYDITDQLRPGGNAIGLWLGVSWSIFPLYKTDDKPQTPIVIAQADIELPDGARRRVVTDESWRVHPSPNVLLGKWMFMNYGGEFYDAEKELPGWCEPDFDDRGWKSATPYEPNVILSAEMLEPNRRVKEIQPVAVQEVAGGEYRVDMGVNYAGFLEFDVRGQPGDVIEFLISEDEAKPMTHRLHSAYRIGPQGHGTFRNRFNYGSGRWIQVKGLNYAPELKDIRGYLVRSDYRRIGTFECSNNLLNQIYETTLWTYENLSVGGYVVDCPQRERMGYGGDAHATTQTALNNYQLGAFYTKWTQDWRDVQSKSAAWGLGAESERTESENEGNLPYTAPTYWGGGGPAWSGICITLPWYIYRHCGDQRVLEINFPTMRRWLAFLETKSKNDMLVRWGGQWDFLGDWLWPGARGVNGDTRETLFFNNCYWIYNLQTASRIADILGDRDLAERYAERADVVRKAVHREFYDPQTNGYVNNLQAYLAAALLTRVPPPDVQSAVWKRFEDEIVVHRKGHFWGGITGGYFIVKALLEFDRPDLMYMMTVKEDYPGWGDMLRRGATTMWESWEGDKSLLHSSYLHVGAWFHEGLAGIRPLPDGAGYKRFLIRPAIAPSIPLESVAARYDSPYGLIRCEWSCADTSIALAVGVPPNTTASLVLPVAATTAVTERDKPVAEADGISVVMDNTGEVRLQLDPGNYEFRIAR